MEAEKRKFSLPPSLKGGVQTEIQEFSKHNWYSQVFPEDQHQPECHGTYQILLPDADHLPNLPETKDIPDFPGKPFPIRNPFSSASGSKQATFSVSKTGWLFESEMDIRGVTLKASLPTRLCSRSNAHCAEAPPTSLCGECVLARRM